MVRVLKLPRQGDTSKGEFPAVDVGPVPRQILTRAPDFFDPTDPSLKTRPCRTRNSVPPAARFGPPARQTLGVLSSRASHAADADYRRAARLQSLFGHRRAR